MRGGRKTQISLGLIHVPAKLPSTTDGTQELRTEQIAPSGAKAKQVYLDEGTGEVVQRDQLRRGVKRGDGYAVIEDAAWDAITEATKLPGAEVLGFITEEELHERRDRVRDSHYVQPDAGGAKALGLIGAVMRAQERVAVLKFAVGSRQRLGALRVREDGALELLTLRSEAEVRAPDEEVLAVTQVEVDESGPEFEMASKLIEGMSADATEVVDGWRDEVVEQRNALIEKALAGEAIPAPEAKDEPQEADVDLLAALSASADAVAPKKKAKPKAKAKAAA